MLKSACTFLCVMGMAIAIAPLAQAANDDPECAALAVSVLPAPDWYAERCLGGAAVTDNSQYKVLPQLVPGDIAFYKNNFPAPLNLKTAPLATLTFTTVGANAQPLFAMTFNLAATILYAVDNTTRQLGTLNQTTGAFTSIGTLTPDPVGDTVTGLAFDPTSSNVYFTATNGATGRLWTINITNAALTLVGPTTNFPFIIDIAVDRTGQMFGHDIAGDLLVSINKATGAVTTIGPTGIAANFAQGMMYDASDDTLYGCAFVIAPAQQGELVRFNKTTGAATIAAGPVPDEMECGAKVPAIRFTGTALAVDTAGNSVMDPAETAVVAPTWRNDSSLSQTNVTGTASAFTGPAGGTYTIVDSSAAYGTIGAGASVSCSTGGNCYSFMASAANRPVQHWDTTFLETLSVPGQTKTWTLHIGDSFTDVVIASGFYRFIETLFHKGITGGCGTNVYCPASSSLREQMAVFVLIAKEGAGYNPPACSPPNLFSDVPDTSPYCKFIEELANRQVVGGCGPNLYCPTSAVTREQMAVFVLKTLDPALNPPACGAPVFADVPASSPFCKWIEELARRGVVVGCGGGNYCPTQPVTREQMGVFITLGFSLNLYGP